MPDLLCCFRTRDHPIRLSSEFRLDLKWWHDFLTSWHGVSLWLFSGMSAPTDMEVTSDAAGSLGFGAYYNNERFSGAWVPSQADQSIPYKELFPVVVASYGAPSGLGDRFFFGQITRLLYTSCLPGRRRFHTLCVFSVIYSLLLLGLTLLSLHRISPTFITILLMLFPVFTGRTSGVWHPRHNFTQLQLLLNSGSS